MLGAARCGSTHVCADALLRPFGLVVTALVVAAIAVGTTTSATRFNAARATVAMFDMGVEVQCRVVEVEKVPDGAFLFSVRLIAEDGLRGWSIDDSKTWSKVVVGDSVACVKTVNGGVAPERIRRRAHSEREVEGAQLALMLVTGICVIGFILTCVATEVQRRAYDHHPVGLSAPSKCGVVDKSRSMTGDEAL